MYLQTIWKLKKKSTFCVPQRLLIMKEQEGVLYISISIYIHIHIYTWITLHVILKQKWACVSAHHINKLQIRGRLKSCVDKKYPVAHLPYLYNTSTNTFKMRLKGSQYPDEWWILHNKLTLACTHPLLIKSCVKEGSSLLTKATKEEFMGLNSGDPEWFPTDNSSDVIFSPCVFLPLPSAFPL